MNINLSQFVENRRAAAERNWETVQQRREKGYSAMSEGIRNGEEALSQIDWNNNDLISNIDNLGLGLKHSAGAPFGMMGHAVVGTMNVFANVGNKGFALGAEQLDRGI